MSAAIGVAHPWFSSNINAKILSFEVDGSELKFRNIIVERMSCMIKNSLQTQTFTIADAKSTYVGSHRYFMFGDTYKAHLEVPNENC